MFAPDRQPRLVALLAAIRRGVREYATIAFRSGPSKSNTFLALLPDIWRSVPKSRVEQRRRQERIRLQRGCWTPR
jgi:hypothetical protein